MKRHFLFAITTLLSYCSFAQAIFIVVDKTDKKPIPYVSVVLLRNNLAATTDEKGEFELDDAITASGDTLSVSVFGYQSVKLPTSYFSNSKSVELPRVAPLPDGVRTAGVARKKYRLNEFRPEKIRHFLGLQKSSEAFNYLQVAQKFELPEKNAMLKQVNIFRLVWKEIERELEDGRRAGVFSDTGTLQKTKFKVRIYDVDSVNGLPGRDLTREAIEVQDRWSDVIKVSLNSFKIRIPQNTFFVAVEWQRIPYNLSRTSVIVDEKLLGLPEEKAAYGKLATACYKPILGMSHQKGPKLNTYALNYKGDWVQYKHFAPELTDFAISAEVEY